GSVRQTHLDSWDAGQDFQLAGVDIRRGVGNGQAHPALDEEKHGAGRKISSFDAYEETAQDSQLDDFRSGRSMEAERYYDRNTFVHSACRSSFIRQNSSFLSHAGL